MIGRQEWIEYFEMIHNRKPTVTEMRTAEIMGEFASKEKIAQYEAQQMQQVQAEADASKFSKISQKSVKALKTGSKWTFGMLMKTLLRFIMTPFVLTSFFFNFIKSCFIIPVVWVISKLMYMLALRGIFYGLFRVDMFKADWTRPFWAWCIGNINEIKPTEFDDTGFFQIFFPNQEVDAIIFLILIVLSALLLTYAKYSSNDHYE
ncbi:hypothetical protein [Streptococcus sobrinus]|uniref:hypothetical protein n=1 Tax=Streptococcus sobrinus TaxID=1310 RepID=UPI0002DDD9D6|nr:hypothetical protein [Streptococcus sobrinus]